MSNRIPTQDAEDAAAEAARRQAEDAITANETEGAETTEDPIDAPVVPPQGGLNPELGDMDAEADPEQDTTDIENGLPGKAGGGLIGG